MDGSHIQYNIDDIVVLYRKGAKQVKYKDVVERTKNESYGSENAMKKECQDSWTFLHFQDCDMVTSSIWYIRYQSQVSSLNPMKGWMEKLVLLHQKHIMFYLVIMHRVTMKSKRWFCSNHCANCVTEFFCSWNLFRAASPKFSLMRSKKTMERNVVLWEISLEKHNNFEQISDNQIIFTDIGEQQQQNNEIMWKTKWKCHFIAEAMYHSM